MNVSAYLPMIRGIVWRMRLAGRVPRWMEMDDLVSVGLLALVKAERRYRPGRGASQKTWAAIRVKGALIDYLRVESPGSRRHLEAVKRSEATGFLNVQLDGLRDAEHLAVVTPEAEWTSLLLASEILAALVPRDRYVLVESFFGGRTNRSIARSLGVNASRVSQIRLRALRRARSLVERRTKERD